MKKLKLIFINLIILFVLLILIDPFINASHGTKTERYVRLREPIPNLDLTFYSSHKRVAGRPFRLRTDDQGFYIGETEIEEIKNPEIIFFGGSTTECSVVDENKRFPYLVGKMLTDSITNQTVKTANAGYSGNNTMHSMINFVAKGIQLRPKIVFVMHNINDLSQLLKTGTYWEAPEGRSIIVDQTNKTYGDKVHKFMKSSKDLFLPNLYASLKENLSSLRNTKINEWDNYRGSELHRIDEIIKEYERAIKSFINLAKLYEVEVVLMTQFNRFDFEDEIMQKEFQTMFPGLEFESFCKFYDMFNNKLREISIEESVYLIDLDKEVSPASKYLYDFVHLNQEGSELVSVVIANWMVENFKEYKLSSSITN